MLLFDLLAVDMPVQTCQEVLMVWPLCQPGDSLAPGFSEQGFLNFPPWVLEVDLILDHEVRGLPCPPVKTGGLPLPFCQIGNSGC